MKQLTVLKPTSAIQVNKKSTNCLDSKKIPSLLPIMQLLPAKCVTASTETIARTLPTPLRSPYDS